MTSDLKTFKVLVVEDNPGDFMIVEDLLTEQFVEPIIIQTTTFKKTSEILLSNKVQFDCILLDLTLPDCSGEELISQMLPIAHSPVIILTGYTDTQFSIRALSAGISDYLIKDELNAALLHKSITYAINRRKASEKLLQSEARLITAQSVAKIGSWATDLISLEVIWSEETYKIFETNSTEFNASHLSFLGFVHPEDKELVDEAFLKSLTTEKTNSVEHRIICLSGKIKYVEEIWQIEKDKNGNPLRAIGTCQDISEKVEIRMQLIKSERENRALIENITDGIIKINEHAQAVFQSSSIERITGFKKEDLKEKTVFDIIHPDDLQNNVIFFQEVLASPGVAKQRQCRILHKKGHYFWIEGTIVNLLHDGNVKALVANFRDITERIEAKEKLKETLVQLEKRVKERTKELSKKNKDILDSINYAKRIQIGLLTPYSQLTELFPMSFILSEPQNIVSGDFFWCHQKHNKKFVVVADCTGHGVPGALISIIGNNLLNSIIIDEQIDNPSEILLTLDQRLKEAMKGAMSEIKDGMDVALCVIDTYFKEVYFAGAYRPLFVSDENGKIHELNGNSFSVGGGLGETKKQFETKRFSIIPGQRIYLTSDGYYSQFGGPLGKKFMKKRFRETLENLQAHPLGEQNNQLKQTLIKWEGKNERVDDIMVVGIEL